MPGTSLGETATQFEIRRADANGPWVRLNEANATIAEPDRTFPSAAQASAAALAFAHRVARAGRALTVATAGTRL